MQVGRSSARVNSGVSSLAGPQFGELLQFASSQNLNHVPGLHQPTSVMPSCQLSSTCATHGSAENTTAHRSSNFKFESPDNNQDKPHKLSSISAHVQHELSVSRTADYLEDPAVSHVHPQHVSSQQSLRILAKKKSHIKALDDILSSNKK
ncbi:hypothetical protein N431DRAFT_445806 [Stipitochalara longipes BDJ]|nr:hypothetical protein N431DRAFT_445806 [Stipitochalara longipes BDJ]